MKSIVQLIFEETLKEVSDLEEAAKTVEEAKSSGLGLVIRNSDYLELVLYDTKQVSNLLSKAEPGIGKQRKAEYVKFLSENAIVGQMKASKLNDGYMINTVAAKDKYGPLMYEILSSLGGFIIPGWDVSNEALAVWKKFFERLDVQREPIAKRGIKALGYRYQVTKKVNYKPLIVKHRNLQKQLEKKSQIDLNTLDLILIQAGNKFFEEMYG